MAFDLFGMLGNALGGLGGALSGATANATQDVTPTVGTDAVSVSAMPSLTSDESTIQNLTKTQNIGTNDFNFSNDNGLGLNSGKLPDAFGKGGIETNNPSAPGNAGTSAGTDWMELAALGLKGLEWYKNDKRADAAINAGITDKKNSIRRSASVQNQMTGGKRPLAAKDEYEYV